MFFIGVISTGIYCRPVCHVRTPERENCRYFDHAAQAERAAFRPCLRCRPELAPRTPALRHDGEPPDTSLAVAQVAHLSGFASVRRFNAAFAQHYALNPTQLRRAGGAGAAPSGIQVRLAYRPPYDVGAMLQFFATRQVAGIETVTLAADQPSLCKTLVVPCGPRHCTGWLEARFDAPRSRVNLRVSDSLRDVLPWVMARVRALLDLDADPRAINSLLGERFPASAGLRVPGTLNGFELAVRAVLGQQITVAGARTLATRLVQQLGEPFATPVAGLNRLFPTPATLAAASGDVLGRLGIVRQRQAAIQAIAQAVIEGRLPLHAGADVPATLATLQAMPGIGDWTAQYIAMRALRWPDTFPAGDVALHRALGVAHSKNPAQDARAAAQAWQPWRSYAVIRAWASVPAAPAPPPNS